MKQGTQFEITLIADERFLGSCKNVETIISVFRSSLKTAVSGEGIEIYSFGEEKLLDNWQGTEKEKQIRQKVTLILSQKKTKDDIYKVINQVQSQPIKFLR